MSLNEGIIEDVHEYGNFTHEIQIENKQPPSFTNLKVVYL